MMAEIFTADMNLMWLPTRGAQAGLRRKQMQLFYGTSVALLCSSVPSCGSFVPSCGSSVALVCSSVPSCGSSAPSCGSFLASCGSSVPSCGSSVALLCAHEEFFVAVALQERRRVLAGSHLKGVAKCVILCSVETLALGPLDRLCQVTLGCRHLEHDRTPTQTVGQQVGPLRPTLAATCPSTNTTIQYEVTTVH